MRRTTFSSDFHFGISVHCTLKSIRSECNSIPLRFPYSSSIRAPHSQVQLRTAYSSTIPCCRPSLSVIQSLQLQSTSIKLARCESVLRCPARPHLIPIWLLLLLHRLTQRTPRETEPLHHRHIQAPWRRDLSTLPLSAKFLFPLHSVIPITSTLPIASSALFTLLSVPQTSDG